MLVVPDKAGLGTNFDLAFLQRAEERIPEDYPISLFIFGWQGSLLRSVPSGSITMQGYPFVPPTGPPREGHKSKSSFNSTNITWIAAAKRGQIFLEI